MVTTAVTLSLVFVVGGSGSHANASAGPATSQFFTACNNTFNGAKFPLEYRIVATPSVFPVPADTDFTVDFNVTVIASAGFLNGVYSALGSAPAIPITEDKATIVAVSGATGAPVQAARTSTFTIPKPPSTPVAAGVDIPIGIVKGSYHSAASGTPSFGIAGNAFSPTDTLPSGVTESAWTGSGASLVMSTTGLQTYTKTSLAGGLVTPYLVCMGGGLWTQGGTTTAPTFAAPFVPSSTGPIGIDGTAVTVPSSSVPETTAPATTQPSTTQPSTTQPSTTQPSTTVPGTVITGTSTYAADCVDSIVGTHYTLSYKGTVSAVSPVATGETIHVTNQSWEVTVPADLAGLLGGILGTEFDVSSTLTLSGTNTSPASATTASVTNHVTLPAAGSPLVSTVSVPDVAFQATGGDAAI